MNTAAILNNYRHSLLSDATGLKTLATIYREGPKQEDVLAARLGLNTVLLKKHLTELFRANLIRQSGEEKWATTEFAELILERIGVSESIVTSLFHAAAFPEHLESFLRGILEARKSNDWGSLRKVIPLLQSASYFAEDSIGKQFINQVLRQRLIVDCIVGLDPASHELGPLNFYKHIFRWHETNRTGLWLQFRHQWKQQKASVVNYLESAIRDVDNSNSLLLKRDSALDFEDHKLDIMLTLTRSCAALLSGVPDSGLGLLSTESNIANYLWRDLSKNHSWVPETCIGLLRRHSKLVDYPTVEGHSSLWLIDLFNSTVLRKNEIAARLLSNEIMTRPDQNSPVDFIAKQYAILKIASSDKTAFDEIFRSRSEFWILQLSQKNKPEPPPLKAKKKRIRRPAS
jgi:hypothetical protein